MDFECLIDSVQWATQGLQPRHVRFPTSRDKKKKQQKTMVIEVLIIDVTEEV